ncbi:CU044_2847 family protein [Symbioplanes lichenis]|uniref:CU044_2847 family protein n=1 Tax=Symbioplanes lichenis TaxID=1629072 RepID=UPI00273A369B|nr:CU044_2847 family protein [Actinoplanes lichenis]
MPELARIELEHGGWLYLEAAGGEFDGPVKAGLADAVSQVPGTLRSALGTIGQASREILGSLQPARPDEVKVEFGVNISVAAGALITKGTTGGHLKVTLTWSAPGDQPAHG